MKMKQRLNEILSGKAEVKEKVVPAKKVEQTPAPEQGWSGWALGRAKELQSAAAKVVELMQDPVGTPVSDLDIAIIKNARDFLGQHRDLELSDEDKFNLVKIFLVSGFDDRSASFPKFRKIIAELKADNIESGMSRDSLFPGTIEGSVFKSLVKLSKNRDLTLDNFKKVLNASDPEKVTEDIVNSEKAAAPKVQETVSSEQKTENVQKEKKVSAVQPDIKSTMSKEQKKTYVLAQLGILQQLVKDGKIPGSSVEAQKIARQLGQIQKMVNSESAQRYVDPINQVKVNILNGMSNNLEQKGQALLTNIEAKKNIVTNTKDLAAWLKLHAEFTEIKTKLNETSRPFENVEKMAKDFGSKRDNLLKAWEKQQERKAAASVSGTAQVKAIEELKASIPENKVTIKADQTPKKPLPVPPAAKKALPPLPKERSEKAQQRSPRPEIGPQETKKPRTSATKQAADQNPKWTKKDAGPRSEAEAAPKKTPRGPQISQHRK
jgi:hypothetical protein